jgi:hypothetical protein
MSYPKSVDKVPPSHKTAVEALDDAHRNRERTPPDPSNPLYTPLIGKLDEVAGRARDAKSKTAAKSKGYSRLGAWAKATVEARKGLMKKWSEDDAAARAEHERKRKAEQDQHAQSVEDARNAIERARAKT